MNILTNPMANDVSLEESSSKISAKKSLSNSSDLNLISHSSFEHISIEDPEESNAIGKIDTVANSIVKLEKPPAQNNHYRLSINLPPLPDLHNAITNIQNRNSDELFRALSEKQEDNFISADMIQRWNNQIGDMDIPEKARKKINQMRKLGGLDASNSTKNIPSARLGLCLLAGLKVDQELKMYALESLLTILKNDEFTKESSYRLVELAMELLNLISREIIQTVDLETEIKLTEIYKVLAETLYIHAGCQHFNGITKETKIDLVTAATAIAKLNRLDNVKIRFNISCAREWLRWLKDDTQELYILSKKLYNLVLAGGAIYLEDAEEGYARLEKALKIKDPRLPKHPWHWHNSLSVMRDLARDVKAIRLHNNNNNNDYNNLNLIESKEPVKDKPNIITNSHNNTISNEKKSVTTGSLGDISVKSKRIDNSDFKVTNTPDYNKSGKDMKSIGSDLKNKKQVYHSEILRLLTLIGKKYAKLDWKFSYGAIEVLFDLVLNGKTPEIRMQAFKGISFREDSSGRKDTKAISLPGLKHFASCKNLGRYIKKKNVVHLELPEIASQNKIIREACAEYLTKLIRESKDEAIVRKSIHLLSDRALYENDDEIRGKIENFLVENSIEYSPRKKEKKLSLSLRGS